MRRRFVSDASHELKTPLASVKVLADSIIQTDDMPPEVIKDFVADIGDEVNRLTRLTEKLLNITRLDSDVRAEIGKVDLKQIVLRAAHMLKHLAELDEVTIVPELSENCFVDASEDDLYQIVFNLMENAIKYNVKGGSVKIFLFEREEQVCLIVSDTGVGIPQEDIERIFERFYRVDKARSREAGGSGLGLAIVKSAVQHLNGTITTESAVGEGTRITVTFPASGKKARSKS
jgi:signal transduction histidine kinase